MTEPNNCKNCKFLASSQELTSNLLSFQKFLANSFLLTSISLYSFYFPEATERFLKKLEEWNSTKENCDKISPDIIEIAKQTLLPKKEK